MIIAYVPVDDRPCNLRIPLKLAALAGINVRTPPRSILGNFNVPGDTEAVSAWLVESAGEADLVVASIEMLCFGGLLASRSGRPPLDLGALTMAKKRNPKLRIDAFAVIMKSSVADPDIRKCGHRAIRASLDLLSRGTIDHLVVGQDDAALTGPHAEERDALIQYAGELDVSDSVRFISGADEIGMMLVSRAASKDDLKVGVLYSNEAAAGRAALYEDRPLRESIEDHVALMEGEIIDSPRGADVLLCVNSPDEKQSDLFLDKDMPGERDDAPFVSSIIKGREYGAVVAVADLRFANGADPAFADRLFKKLRPNDLASFSAWNTASNSIGSALAHSFLVASGKVRRDGRGQAAFIRERIADEYLYQSVLRRRIRDDVVSRGVSPFDLRDHYHPVNWAVKEELKNMTSAFFREKAGVEAALPWPRIFEVDINIHY